MLGLREANESRVYEMVGLRYAAKMTESRWQRDSTMTVGLIDSFAASLSLTGNAL